MKRLTLKFKITLWYALFLLVLLSIFSVFLYFAISELLYNSTEDLLKADTKQVMSILQVEGSIIRLEVQGSTLRAYWDGTPASSLPSATDTSIASAGDGVGFFHYSSAHHLDDWSGGDLLPASIPLAQQHARFGPF